METITLKAEGRARLGTRVARRERRQGLVPAVMLRKREAPIHLLVPAKELSLALRKGARLVELMHPGGRDRVFVKEVQYDHTGQSVYHVDFAQVAMDEMLTLEVRLVLKGKPIGVVEEGGVLDQYVQLLRVQCPAGSIPDQIEVDVAHLKKDQHLTIKDVTPPPGVKLLQDPDLVVATVTEHKIEEAPVAAAAAAVPAEPEVIRKEKAEEVPAEGAKPEKAEKPEKKEAAARKEEKK